jgi:hypothetical protein
MNEPMNGANGPVIDGNAIMFLFNSSPSVNIIAEGGTEASETPKTGADVFASYILEQFKARVAKSSRKPWVEAEEYYYQIPRFYDSDADFIRTLAETVAYPDKLNFDELMKIWQGLPKRARKKARKLIVYKIVEYGAEEFLKLIMQSEQVQRDAEVRNTLMQVAQAFVDKKIGVRNLTKELEDMILWWSWLRLRIEEDSKANIDSILAGLHVMELSRKDRLREIVKKYIIDELIAIRKKLEEKEVDFYWDEDPYGVPCDEDCEDLDDDYEDFDDECECIEDEDYYYEDDDDP